MHVGKGRPQPTQGVLQPLKARPLARKRNLFDHVLPEELPSSIEFSLIQNFLYESADNVAVTLHAVCPLLNRMMMCSAVQRLSSAARGGRRPERVDQNEWLGVILPSLPVGRGTPAPPRPTKQGQHEDRVSKERQRLGQRSKAATGEDLQCRCSKQ